MNCMSTLYERVVECGVLSPGLFYIHKKKEKKPACLSTGHEVTLLVIFLFVVVCCNISHLHFY